MVSISLATFEFILERLEVERFEIFLKNEIDKNLVGLNFQFFLIFTIISFH